MAGAATTTLDPPATGPLRYLGWLVAAQPRRVAVGALLSSAWMVTLAAPAYVLSRAVDEGLEAGDPAALARWAAALLLVGLLTAGLSIARHRTMTRVRMTGAFVTSRAVVEHVTRLGAALPAGCPPATS